ncbi:MAG: winged helix-turn-helix domain-containing protein [Gammaproteobacteria bacterium]
MSAETPGASIQVGEWIVEPALDLIWRAGETQKLEPRTMRLLLCLIDSAGAVVSIDKLLSEVWTGVIVGSASVYQAVSQLRKILGDTDPEPTYIATVPRKGYRLIAPVRAIKTGYSADSETTATPPAWAAKPPSAAIPPPAEVATDGRASDAGQPRKLAPALSRRVTLIAMCAIAIAGVAALVWLRLLKPPIGEAMASIVVLPFVDMTAEKGDQPFCDGLTEELSNWLAQIPALRVVARTSAFAFRGQGEDVRKIGRALDTNHVLEGSMRRSGDHMRVTVQLIDARSGYHLWSANYDRPMADTIKMQEDISRSVAENLEIRLTADTSQRFAARSSSNPQAYQLYLLARHHQQKRTAQSNTRAIQLYRQALEQDPKFSLAYVGLAYALLNENWLGERPINEIAAEAEPLLDTALKLDPGLSDIYAVRGALRGDQFRNDEALSDLGHAAALNPNDGLAFTEMGRLYLMNKGQPRDSLINYTRAATLDPLNYQPQAQRCVALQDLGRFDEAAAACARARELQPQDPWPLATTSWLAAAQGRLDEALKWNAMALKVAPDVFEFYQQRVMWLLILGLPARAREALEVARIECKGDEAIDDALADIVYYEGGTPALREYLVRTRMEDSSHASRLLVAAYYRLLIGDSAVAKENMERALKAPDFSLSAAASPWDAAHWGHSDDLIMALIDLQNGNNPSAMRYLDAIATTLDQLVRNGDKLHGVDELRASVLALRGDADGAMRSLARAANLGWRRSWWAEREPDLHTLQERGDFRALMARVNESNADLRKRVIQ